MQPLHGTCAWRLWLYFRGIYLTSNTSQALAGLSRVQEGGGLVLDYASALTSDPPVKSKMWKQCATCSIIMDGGSLSIYSPE